MIKVTIASSEVREMKGIGKTSGKPYHMRFQTAYAHTVSPDGVVAPFPDKFEISLEEEQPPFKAGDYVLQPSSISVSREGRLEARPRLAPVSASKSA